MFTILKILTSAAALLSVVRAAQAPANTDSPRGVKARADFDAGKLHGVIKFGTAKNGTVKVHLDVTGLPDEGGPFTYHIHQSPVPPSGDCEATGTHFNPYGAPPNCDAQQDDSYCQVGDLSGKHGWINTTCFETKYYDQYLSLNPNNPAYIVDRSVTIHFANLTKITCANIGIYKGKVSAKEEEEFDAEELIPVNKELSYGTEAGSQQKEVELLQRRNLTREPNATTFNPNGNLTSSNITTASWDYENGGKASKSSSFGIALALVASFLI